jgi:hypothetical protein
MLMAWTAGGVRGALHLENAGGFANTCDMGLVLERERAFYNAHQAEWAALHLGRFVVVKGEELIGTYETMDLALAAGASRFGLDSFLVRKLGETEQEIHVPALALGLLFAPSHGPTGGGSSGS